MRAPIKPKPLTKHKLRCIDLCNRLQVAPTRARAISELIERLYLSDENSLVAHMLRSTSTTITTHQLNSERDDGVFLINMSFADRTKTPINGHYYPPVYVIKNWNSLNDGVILSYLTICKQIGRFI